MSEYTVIHSLFFLCMYMCLKNLRIVFTLLERTTENTNLKILVRSFPNCSLVDKLFTEYHKINFLMMLRIFFYYVVEH